VLCHPEAAPADLDSGCPIQQLESTTCAAHMLVPMSSVLYDGYDGGHGSPADSSILHVFPASNDVRASSSYLPRVCLRLPVVCNFNSVKQALVMTLVKTVAFAGAIALYTVVALLMLPLTATQQVLPSRSPKTLPTLQAAVPHAPS
jgi:hypothetical protein